VKLMMDSSPRTPTQQPASFTTTPSPRRPTEARKALTPLTPAEAQERGNPTSYCIQRAGMVEQSLRSLTSGKQTTISIADLNKELENERENGEFTHSEIIMCLEILQSEYKIKAFDEYTIQLN